MRRVGLHGSCKSSILACRLSLWLLFPFVSIKLHEFKSSIAVLKLHLNLEIPSVAQQNSCALRSPLMLHTDHPLYWQDFQIENSLPTDTKSKTFRRKVRWRECSLIPFKWIKNGIYFYSLTAAYTFKVNVIQQCLPIGNKCLNYKDFVDSRCAAWWNIPSFKYFHSKLSTKLMVLLVFCLLYCLWGVWA